MEWLRLVESIKSQVSFAKEPYERDNILQKRPVNLSILLTVATPYDQFLSVTDGAWCYITHQTNHGKIAKSSSCVHHYCAIRAIIWCGPVYLLVACLRVMKDSCPLRMERGTGCRRVIGCLVFATFSAKEPYN